MWTLKPYAKMPNSMPGTQRALNTLHNKQVDKERLERMSLWKANTYWNRGYGYQQGYGPGYGGSNYSPHGYYGYSPGYYYRPYGIPCGVTIPDNKGCPYQVQADKDVWIRDDGQVSVSPTNALLRHLFRSPVDAESQGLERLPGMDWTCRFCCLAAFKTQSQEHFQKAFPICLAHCHWER
ncbi:Mucin-21 [Manis pentadactyla]|nr:Mucin-21 [Manis pentadactyla]